MSRATSKVIDGINLRTMTSAAAVADYSHSQSLNLAENASLNRVLPEVRNKPILDIGVGAGRTTGRLLKVSRDYLGIDYSHAMLAAARERHPEARLEYADARNVTLVPDESIFLVMFSCNGIGMVSHEDRILILREVFRVLKPGGVFLFSTHNRDSGMHRAGFRVPAIDLLSKNPVRLVARSIRFARSTLVRALNRRRFMQYEQHTADYSIVNDRCHDYATMLYYIGLDAQRRQLEEAGFAPKAEAYDLKGNLVEESTSDDSMAFVARKAPTPT